MDQERDISEAHLQTPLVRYHKDQWNEKDYTHTGLGALFKKMNG